MIASTEEKKVFSDIQKKLFYMIPEKWESVYLYASMIEEPFKKPVGEMYFYYLPKGILKKNPINVYEIPGLFNIDEEQYNVLINNLYMDIKKLREIAREKHSVLWSNITISMENTQFKIEYDYTDLSKNSEFTPYERHIIWRYKYLNIEKNLQKKEDKIIIEKYLNSNEYKNPIPKKEYVESIYISNDHNIVDYQKTMTVEAAIAQKSQEENEPKQSKKFVFSKKKKEDENQENENQVINNAILFGNKKDYKE